MEPTTQNPVSNMLSPVTPGGIFKKSIFIKILAVLQVFFFGGNLFYLIKGLLVMGNKQFLSLWHFIGILVYLTILWAVFIVLFGKSEKLYKIARIVLIVELIFFVLLVMGTSALF